VKEQGNRDIYIQQLFKEKQRAMLHKPTTLVLFDIPHFGIRYRNMVVLFHVFSLVLGCPNSAALGLDKRSWRACKLQSFFYQKPNKII